ncbi:carboxypeptidase-like regulatory domain-containing protein [Mucilaginibacter sp. SMC90]|uniref:alpha-2-macroglobulin family protein n=1 Tax=Mucilaginibacter sp. SMC90 TaxID=2929803 RepID=UPI001FB52898|nr:alpha-2-macroglobulin family protein [Mucilaginibacter sp. SMC90]UOE47761.1 carboxypeptidase-like regulatory domain-containing protein [Mucilaginibacter sp. SMC90]
MQLLSNLNFFANKLKKTFLIANLLLICSSACAQNYEQIDHRIDSLVQLGLPKLALAEVDLLEQLARKNHNAPQQIKSTLYRMNLQSYLEENALVAIIDSLRSDISHAVYPVKPVLQSLLGSMYYTYYQQNRWQFGQRTKLEQPLSDYTQWDLQTLIDETSRLYLQSLQDTKREQATSIKVLDGVLEGDPNARYLRPTLYDLLVYRALEFFLSDEPALTKSVQAFTLDDKRFFGDSRSFGGLTIKTTDTASTYYNGVRLLQQASLFHLRKEGDEALADLDIKRLEFLFNKSSFARKDSLYTGSLRQVAAAYSGKPISADAWVALGRYYQQKDSLLSAMQYFQIASSRFPGSLGAHNAATLIKQVQRRELSAAVEDLNIPGKPILALINYRNVKAVRYSIYRLSQQQYTDYKNSWSGMIRRYSNSYDHTKPSQEDWINNFVKLSKPVQRQQLQLPDPYDLRMHRTEFAISGLPSGPYILYIEDGQSADTSLVNYADFQVSRLAYTARINPDSRMEIKVMDRKTGEPLKGVHVKVKGWSNTDKSAHTENGLTDKTGGISGINLEGNNVAFELLLKDDTLTTEQNYIVGSVDDEKPEDKTVLFTDRQIYRPGQIIYFKGLELQLLKGRSAIQANKLVDIDFRDPNNKTLSTLNLKSNDFGTFSDSFVVPQNILNGNVKIRTASGEVNIRVEEYKRPTFRTEFSAVTESYKLNDSVRLKGSTMALSGYGLSRARVAYHITRYPVYSYNYRTNSCVREIISDTVYTDEQGHFTIRFKAFADLSDSYNVVYNYALNADITDGTGETQSVNTAVKVGNNNIVINSDVPASILAGDTSGISATLSNLNGQRSGGKLQVQVYALQNPPHIFKNRVWWRKPDLFLMDRNAYHANFPYYAFDRDDDCTTWRNRDKLSDSTYTLADTGSFCFYLQGLHKQRSGVYKLVLKAKNQKGDTATVIYYFNLVGDTAVPSTMDGWVVATGNKVKPGSKAEFLVGINEPVHVLMEKYRGVLKVSSQWLHIDKGQKVISVPIDLTDNDVNVQFMMAFQNRVYTSFQKVNIVGPNKLLNIKMLTFRDKLQPGDKEQWKLQISTPGNEKQSAEMVAGMYDESLDDIAAPASWRSLLDQPRSSYYNYFGWNNYNFVKQENSRPLVYRDYIYQLQRYNYETLNLFGYGYFGGYNNAYHNYLRNLELRSAAVERDSELEHTYYRNAALVKDGVDITGVVVDDRGFMLPGVTVNIEGENISTVTDSKGGFRIRVPVNGILSFSYIGYNSKKLPITRAGHVSIVIETNLSLSETVVVGDWAKGERAVMRSVSGVSFRDWNSLPTRSLVELLQGKVAGSQVVNGQSGMNGIMIGGLGNVTGSTNAGNGMFFVVDGVVTNTGLSNIAASDIVNIEILKGADATAIYGARAANGVAVVTTNSGRAKLTAGQPIAIRKNFNETAFFYPQLRTDDKGEILIDFTIPEALTRWKFRAFAHTRDLKTGYIEKEMVTQKQLGIGANTPRFLREGDTVTISARLANLSVAPLKCKVNLQLFNGINMQPVSLLVNPAEALQDVEVNASGNKAVSFKLAVPSGLVALTYRLTANAAQFSDGEENTLPILSNRMLVTESMPMMVRPSQTRTFTFDKLLKPNSNTLDSKTLTLEYTQNPAWYAVQALPYMMEFPYECSEQMFNRYFANSLGINLINKMPAIRQVFEQWKASKSAELTSNLEKNSELKSTLLEETPWLRDAANESEQKKRIALLFNLNKMNDELQLNLDKLQKRQMSDGGFPWFGGDRSDEYITRYILAGIGQLYHLGIIQTSNKALKDITDKALIYMDNQLMAAAARAKVHKEYEGRLLAADEIHSYYVDSYFTDRSRSDELKSLLAGYLKLATVQWKANEIYQQALIALTMQRNNHPEVAKAIVSWLNQTAQHKEEMGMYWGKNQLGYNWYQSPIETQSLLIELFTEVGGYDKEVEEMKIWLLRNKQTHDWKTTKATAAACYALLLKGDNWLADKGLADIKLGNKNLQELTTAINADDGTGYIKTSWADDAVKPALGNVVITNNGKTVSWGALHWQYLENLDKITSSNTDIRLQRKYFLIKQTSSGEVLMALDDTHQPKTGDLLKVVVYLKSGRQFEYVHLKDMRPAGTEPLDAISSYRYQDGLYYYQVTKDIATNFFISYLDKGSYVFEYRLRVVQPGNFATGISTMECMYAPEFNAHSEGIRMLIK